MNFLDKAKKKQAELKAQYDKVSKDIAKFNIGGDKSASTTGPQGSEASTAAGSTVLTPATTTTATSTTETASSAAVPASATASTDSPQRPAVKLSLVQRKDVRDTWENDGKPAYEERLSKCLGTKWSLVADAGSLLNPKGDGVAADIGAPGNMIKDYMSSAVMRVEEKVSQFGPGTAEELNILAFQHIISLEIDTEITKDPDRPSDYMRTDFNNGRIRVLINQHHLWSGANQACDKLDRVMLEERDRNPQLQDKIDFMARNGIEKDWEKNVDKTLAKAREELNDPNFQFDPRFLQVWTGLRDYAKTKAGKKKWADMIWPQNVGEHMWSYFFTFQRKLESEKFEDDDMLQEAFKEAVPKGVVAFRLVEATNKKNHEVAVDDGILYLQTTAENFFSHTGTVTEHMMEIL